MNKIFVTADTHFGHVNISGPALSSWSKGYRNFASVDEMDNTIIDNINSVVGEGDVLYHLGDFAMGPRDIPGMRARIKCRTIHLLLGNHDDTLDPENRKFKREAHTKHFSTIRRYREFRYGKKLITMGHYPLGSWNEVGRGAINLYGHCHGTYTRDCGRQMDVGMDCHGPNSERYTPMLLDDIVDYMRHIEPESVDHHDKGTSYH